MNERNIFLIKEFATQYDLDWRLPYAILMTESGGKFLDDKGNVINRFERVINAGFVSVLNKQAIRHPQLPGLDALWIRKHTLAELHQMSTSWGVAQIMGWHYPMLGYQHILDMIDAYKAHEDIQLRSFFIFCVRYRDGKFLKAMDEMNYKKVAEMYNGSGYAKNKYDTKLKKFVNSQT